MKEIKKYYYPDKLGISRVYVRLECKGLVM